MNIFIQLKDNETLPYKDFLFFRNDYEIIKIVEY